MPRALRQAVHQAAQGRLSRHHGPTKRPSETTRTVNYPTRAQLEQLETPELDLLRSAQRDSSTKDSSDSDQLVKRKHPKKASLAKAKEDDPTLMRGALDDITAVNNARANRKILESDVTKRVRRSLQKEGVKNALKSPGEKLRRKATSISDRRLSPSQTPTGGLGWTQEELGASPNATGVEAREHSVDVSTNRASTYHIKATKEHARRDAPSAVPPTPSFLSIANFKRRPRQPSLLNQVQRAESRRNSMLSAASREDVPHLDEGVEDDSVLTFGDIPMHDEDDDIRVHSAGSMSSRKRKRDVDVQITAIESPGSSPPTGSLKAVDLPAPVNGHSRDEPTTAVSQPRRPRQHEASQRHSSTSQDSAPIMPQSRKSQTSQHRSSRRSARSGPARFSSPVEASSPKSTPSSSPAHRPRAQPSTTKLTSTKKTPKSTSHKHEKPLTSAQLTSFLPKRNTRRKRRRRVDEFQILTTDNEDDQSDNQDGEDDESADELAASSRARARKAKAMKKGVLGGSNANGKPPARRTTASKGKTKKAYGRRSSAAYEAENADEPNESDGDGFVEVEETGGKGQELQDAKAKFEEVDDWELSFESADIGGGSSSPWR